MGVSSWKTARFVTLSEPLFLMLRVYSRISYKTPKLLLVSVWLTIGIASVLEIKANPNTLSPNTHPDILIYISLDL